MKPPCFLTSLALLLCGFVDANGHMSGGGIQALSASMPAPPDGENNIQLLVHSNGEAATDLLIASLRAAEEKHGAGDRRPVLIHGQFQREDQVAACQKLGLHPSLFPMHTFYWGDWHREHTVGPERAGRMLRPDETRETASRYLRLASRHVHHLQACEGHAHSTLTTVEDSGCGCTLVAEIAKILAATHSVR